MHVSSFIIHAGTISSLQSYKKLAMAVDDTDEDPATKTSCNKDTGGKVTLQKWTRGTWFCVSGGGHIHMWQPLYK